MKAFLITFAILGISATVAAFWNPIHIITAFACFLMVANAFGHLNEKV